MEQNNKETNQEHVKIYDKDLYISQEKLKTILLIIIAFLIGFLTGYFSRNIINESIENNINTKVEVPGVFKNEILPETLDSLQ